MGRRPAETIVKNAKWVNVHSGEIIPATDIAIYGGRFAYVGADASHTIGPKTRIIDAAGRYASSGFCEGQILAAIRHA
jgi:adenine deaminase